MNNRQRLSRVFKGLAVCFGSVGLAATLVCVSVQAQSNAYVLGHYERSVFAIDTATRTVFGTVAVGAEPYAAAITPDGSRLYVTNQASNTVSVIDTATLTVSATIPVGIKPQGVSITPNGARAYVANGSSNTVSVINTASNQVIATIGVESYPIGVATSSDGLFVFVTNWWAQTISVIETTTNFVIALIVTESRPLNIALTPGSLFAYVTHDGTPQNAISVFNLSLQDLLTHIDDGAPHNQVGITPDGSKAFITGAGLNGRVTVIDTTTNALITTISTGAGVRPTGIAFTPDGQFAYVTNASSGEIVVVDTNSYEVVDRIDIDGVPTFVLIH